MIAKARRVRCPICEDTVERRARQQVYCNRKCMRKANYARKAGLGLLLGQDTAVVPDPHESFRHINGLQGAKSRSTAGIVGPRNVPRHVFQCEVIAGREWQEIVSTDGVTSYVTRLSKRTLRETAAS